LRGTAGRRISLAPDHLLNLEISAVNLRLDATDNRIEPSPLRWLAIWHHKIDDKTVAAVDVPDEWFWVRFEQARRQIYCAF